MLMHFSDERMVKWQSFDYSKQVKCLLLPTYTRLFSFANLCCVQFDVNTTDERRKMAIKNTVSKDF